MFLKVAIVYEFHSYLLFKFKPGEDITALGGSVVAPGGEVLNNTRGHSFGFYTRRRNNNIISAGGASRTTDGVTVLVYTI